MTTTMCQTLTAMTSYEPSLWTMKAGLLALGASLDAITLRPGLAGHTAHEISVTVCDPAQTQCYRDALELGGGTLLGNGDGASGRLRCPP